jgi:hypothetical protein
MEHFKMTNFAAIEEVEGHKAAFPFLTRGIAKTCTIVDIGRVGHLEEHHLGVVVALIGSSHSRLEAIEVVPIVGAEEYVDWGGIVFKAADCESVLTETEHPVGGWRVVYVEEVGVVEEADITGRGNDALAEKIAEFFTDGTADYKIEITAVETVGVFNSVVEVVGVVIIVKVGTGFEFNLSEYGSEVNLSGSRGGYSQQGEQAKQT